MTPEPMVNLDGYHTELWLYQIRFIIGQESHKVILILGGVILLFCGWHKIIYYRQDPLFMK